VAEKDKKHKKSAQEEERVKRRMQERKLKDK
jgi:hypothetical protein